MKNQLGLAKRFKLLYADEFSKCLNKTKQKKRTDFKVALVSKMANHLSPGFRVL